MRKHLKIYTFLCLFFTTIQLFASPVDSTRPPFWRKLNPDSFHLKWLPLPTVQIGPEIGVGVGASLDYFFNFRNEADLNDNTRESYVWLQGLYSTRKQAISDVKWQIYTPHEHYFTRGNMGYLNFNESFWGIGNDVIPLEDKILASYQRFFVQTRILRRVHTQYFVGLGFNFSQTKNIIFDLSTPYNALLLNLEGANQSQISGLGPSFLADFRDNPYSPTKGWYCEFTPILHKKWLGSNFDYLDILFDIRKYYELTSKDFLGFQGFANLTEGTVPWRELPRLGSPQLMRGFTAGRYRDAQFAAAQVEYRRRLNRYFVAAAFLSTGQVANKRSDFNGNNWHFSYGGGLRVLMNKKKNIYLRFDYARSTENDSGLYFRIGDAF